MVRCKNTGGAPSDGDDSPPHLSEVARGKRIKIMARKKKKKKTLTDAEIAQAVADAADRQRGEVGAVVFALASVAFILKVDSLVQRLLRPLRAQR
jgi:uncharacterized membrane protein